MTPGVAVPGFEGGIGIVVVSHSWRLAEDAVALASEVAATSGTRLVACGGLDEHTFGTDAVRVADAIASADAPGGVLVLMDLGSAVLSAELALELLEPELAARVRLSAAPLVEGLIAAVATASGGGSLEAAAAEAERGLEAKRSHLSARPDAPRASAAGQAGKPCREGVFVVRHPHGLHVRPAAALVAGLAGLDAHVLLRVASGREANADSVTEVMALGVAQGDTVTASVTGPDASAALDRLALLLGRD